VDGNASAPPPAAPPRQATPQVRPAFVPKPDSVFGDKLKQALLAPVQDRES